jgi:outer membrane protein OmpA-like peptidoglycan-associated protein
LGSAHPVADNESPDGRARNRRVEIVISGGPLAVASN